MTRLHRLTIPAKTYRLSNVYDQTRRIRRPAFLKNRHTTQLTSQDITPGVTSYRAVQCAFTRAERCRKLKLEHMHEAWSPIKQPASMHCKHHRTQQYRCEATAWSYIFRVRRPLKTSSNLYVLLPRKRRSTVYERNRELMNVVYTLTKQLESLYYAPAEQTYPIQATTNIYTYGVSPTDEVTCEPVPLQPAKPA